LLVLRGAEKKTFAFLPFFFLSLKTPDREAKEFISFFLPSWQALGNKANPYCFGFFFEILFQRKTK